MWFWKKKADKEVVFDPQVVFDRGRVICREFDDQMMTETLSINGKPYRKETRIVVFRNQIFSLVVFHSAKCKEVRKVHLLDDLYQRTECSVLIPTDGFESVSLGGIDLIGYKK